MKISRLFILALLLWTCSSPLLVGAQFYNGTNMEFGKNRVQYRQFDWYYYPTEKYDVYYYQGGQKLAEYVTISMQKNLKEIEAFFDYEMEDKIQVITYLKQSEFRQNNIGIANDDQFNIGGTARIMGNKMFVYYEGNHRQLEYQVRENLARVLLSQMLYGGDWKDVIKSSTLLAIPEWFEKGLAAYVAKENNAEVTAFMQDLVQSNRFKSFNRYSGNEALLIGHAFWNYVADVYGESVIPNLLYMTRISRNVESGFLYVLGLSLETIAADFIAHYTARLSEPDPRPLPGYEPFVGSGGVSKEAISANKTAYKNWKKRTRTLGVLPVKFKRKYTYSQFETSPDQTQVAFVTNEMGQYKIWLHNIGTGKTKRILKREYRIDRPIDHSFPVLAWHPTSQLFSFITEEKGRAMIASYNLGEKKTTWKELFRIDKVVDMQYSDDGKKIVFSGVREGQTDLYLYQVIGNNQEQLTSDIYDDLYPKFIRNSTAVIFSSNRYDDTLRKDVMVDVYPLENDIFIYDLETRPEVLERITITENADEIFAAEYDSKHYTYLSNQSGVYNRYVANIDSAISAVDTTIHYRYFTTANPLSDFPRDAHDYHFNTKSHEYSLVFRKDLRYLFFKDNTSADRLISHSSPQPISSEQVTIASQGVQTLSLPRDTIRPDQVDIDNYVFEDERQDYNYEKETIRIQEVSPDGTALNKDSLMADFKLPKSRTYRLNFATDYALIQVNNSFFNPFYQTYSYPTSITPGFSAVMKLGVSDLFEDQKIVGGIRAPLNLQSSDYGISYENLSGRLDKKITLMRQSQSEPSDYDIYKNQSYTFLYQLKWPLNELTSIRSTATYRNDRKVRMSVDPTSLASANNYKSTVGLRVEYVFDNTVNKGLNLYYGTRYKFWAERYQRADTITGNTDVNVAGFDFRHYHKIHREMIATFRVAGATSFGNVKVVHYLGGVDNWILFERSDESMPIAQNQNYQYQALASPMRGFYLNSRNGNSFAVANAEVRWPIFRYFMKKPIKSDFLENFQLMIYGDAGSAWTGNSPYSDENMLNNQSEFVKPVTVTINNNREPIVYGYGFGLRSRVLGYFMRADWAWGIDDGQVLPRVFYLSLNLDF